MIQINLLPENLRKKSLIPWEMPSFINWKVVILFVWIFFGIQVLGFGLVGFQYFELIKVSRDVVILREQNKEILQRKSENTRMKNEIRQIKLLAHPKFYWTVLLDALTHSMTKGIWLRSLSLGEDKKSLELDGSILAQGEETAAIAKFIKGLKENPQLGPLFEDIQLSTLNQKRIKDLDVYEFSLIGIFKKDKI